MHAEFWLENQKRRYDLGDRRRWEDDGNKV
jgi:hypothetical protein